MQRNACAQCGGKLELKNITHRQQWGDELYEFENVPALVTNTADSGDGSLRQALLDAAGAPGLTHTIEFELPAGAQTIELLSPLPTITDPIIFDLDSTQSATIEASPANAWDNYGALTKTGDGSLTLEDVESFNANILVEAGTLVLDGNSTPTATSSLLVTVSGTGTLELAGPVPDLPAGVDIVNNSTAPAGILVSGMNQGVGSISGDGNVVVDSGSNITVDSVDQNSLSIGAGSTFTIAPSGPGISTDSTAVPTAPSTATAGGSDSGSDSGSDALAAIQAAAASGSISSVKGQQLENRIAAIERLAATDPGLDVSLLESNILAALPAQPAPTTKVAAATSADDSQRSSGATPTVTVAPPVHTTATPASFVEAVPDISATAVAGGGGFSAGRDSLLSQLFEQLGEDMSGAGIHFGGPRNGSFSDPSLGDTTIAEPAAMGQITSRMIFESLGLDFAGMPSIGSRRASRSERIVLDSVDSDWSDDFLSAVSAFGDSSAGRTVFQPAPIGICAGRCL